jgi:hypothetical protein
MAADESHPLPASAAEVGIFTGNHSRCLPGQLDILLGSRLVQLQVKISEVRMILEEVPSSAITLAPVPVEPTNL